MFDSDQTLNPEQFHFSDFRALTPGDHIKKDQQGQVPQVELWNSKDYALQYHSLDCSSDSDIYS